MTLQYKIDDIESRTDAQKTSEDIAPIIAANTEKQKLLSSEITKLQESITVMKVNSDQQASMHQAMCDGLESQYEKLLEENAEICDELQESRDYIERLEALNMDLETTRNEVIIAVDKMTGIATIHAAEFFEGFSSNVQSHSPLSEKLTFLTRWIDHASENLRRSKNSACQISSEAATPKIKGGSGKISAMNLASQHLDILNELRNTKVAIGAILSSPKLTPIKSHNHKKCEVQTNDQYDEEDLHSDLLRAHGQLEKLSKKIETFHDIQKQWEEKETSLQNHIQSQQDLVQIKQAKLKETSVIMMSNFQHRYHQRVMQHAFQTWSSQVRLTKNMTIAKKMAEEFAKTKEKVLLLKSHLD